MVATRPLWLFPRSRACSGQPNGQIAGGRGCYSAAFCGGDLSMGKALGLAQKQCLSLGPGAPLAITHGARDVVD